MNCIGSIVSIRAGQELAKMVPDNPSPEYLDAVLALTRDLESKTPQAEWREIKAGWKKAFKRIFKKRQ